MIQLAKAEPIWLGGSFNPPHHGHLICARAAAEATGASGVILVPAHASPLKPTAVAAASVVDRLEMCRLAAASAAGFTVDALETQRPPPSFTIDTIRQLRAAGWGRVNWLIGSDTLPSLHAWHEFEKLLREANLIVMARPGSPIDWNALHPSVRMLQERVVAVPQIDISATEIRRRVAEGLPIDWLLPPAVAEYILQRRLYRTHPA